MQATLEAEKDEGTESPWSFQKEHSPDYASELSLRSGREASRVQWEVSPALPSFPSAGPSNSLAQALGTQVARAVAEAGLSRWCSNLISSIPAMFISSIPVLFY